MESIKELRKICQSNKLKNRYFLSRFGYLWHRKISIYITRFLLIFFPSITPNFVSVMMIVISLIGASFLFCGNYLNSLLGIFLVYIGFLLDKCDGEISRYKKNSSLRGVYLDELYHLIVPAILIISFFNLSILNSDLSIYLMIFTVLLVIWNRINRKLPIVIFVKKINLLQHNKINNIEKNKFIQNIFNNYLFKIFGIIFRFDLLLLLLFFIILIEGTTTATLRVYFLYIYFIFNLVHFIRWIILDYFGGIDKKVYNLVNNFNDYVK